MQIPVMPIIILDMLVYLSKWLENRAPTCEIEGGFKPLMKFWDTFRQLKETLDSIIYFSTAHHEVYGQK